MHATTFFAQKISVSHEKYVILYQNWTNNKNRHTNMKKYSGIVLIVLGTIMLLVSYFQKGYLVDSNWWNLLSLVFIIAGIVTHIAVIKRT